ncbi:baculoviral IAP repeat-containing protein 7-B-like [Daphnia pulex]|uniref:baculoviral IAP repeat-containing protein 7-B-like n=1 Tax=Daphnia pulex TaxID=6669 RepID=UPI001EDE576A|nr:baculoviral IAP repeat-containing protein 7-B-like [Daphnia pulex]
MDNISLVPTTASVFSNKLSKVGPTGSIRALSHLNLRTASARLSTFQRWEQSAPNSPTPQALSSAGFIYRGVGDHTQCFTCLVVLSQWHIDHDPDLEHRRHSPRCEFVLNRERESRNNNHSRPISLSDGDINLLSVVPAKDDRHSTEASLCKICYSHDMSILFRPCGHLLTCKSCADQLSHCPICRCPIFEKIRAFVSFE